MPLPRMVTCRQCTKQFETTMNVDTCPSCLIKPHRQIEFHTQEDDMKLSERECPKCLKQYTPTGTRQQTCTECGVSHKKKTAKPKPPVVKNDPAPPVVPAVPVVPVDTDNRVTREFVFPMPKQTPNFSEINALDDMLAVLEHGFEEVTVKGFGVIITVRSAV